MNTYDVVIYDAETKRVKKISFRDRPLRGSFSAESGKLAAELSTNTLDNEIAIVLSGTYEVGDYFQE